MPIIFEDQAVQNGGTAPVNAGPQYSPKDYSSVLTGNGIRQGLLKNDLLAEGNFDIIPPHIMTTLGQSRHECLNKAHHVYDDKHNYTVLHQDVSLCGGYVPGPASSYHSPFGATSQTAAATARALPLKLFSDHLITLENNMAETRTFRARLFLKTVYVYKSSVSYVLPSYVLAATCDEMPDFGIVKGYDTLYAKNPTKDPIPDLYASLTAEIKTRMAAHGNFVRPVVDDSAQLANFMRAKTIYDLIMDELAIIKTPGVLNDTLKALSANSYETLQYANNILSLINIPFALYQADVIDVINARTRNEATSLKNANMSLSLADTLNSMQGQSNAVIPELTGKHYTTNKLTLTTEQIAAIETDSKITIVAAGAGTGKSSCIMHRLAFMEENGCDMKQTFVLSFTKAAASHIKKNFKDCKSSTIAEFTHNFVNVILDNGTGERVDIISHSDFVQKLKIRADDMKAAKILQPSTEQALNAFISGVDNMEANANNLLDMLDINQNPEANNLLSILKMLHCSSLELDPIIFHSQLSMVKPNIEHIVIDESQDSNRLEFLTMLRMAMTNNISVYIVGDCAQTLYEFRDADPRILNNLTKLFKTFDLSINHRSTQIILDVANLMSATMNSHKTILKSNTIMQITRQAVEDTVQVNTYNKVTDPPTMKILDDYIEKHIGKGESIAVIARSGRDVDQIYEYLHVRYGATYTVQNITSARRNDITILSAIGENLESIFPHGTKINSWAQFEQGIRNENIRINSVSRRPNKYNQNGPTVNKVTDDWLRVSQADANRILAGLNDNRKQAYDAEIRRLQISLLDAQTKKNNELQRVMDSKNAKLKQQKADIIVCTVHGVKGLEYDHVACFINTEADRNRYSSSDENKRIAYVALTRAKMTECVFCTREKLMKDFEAYKAKQPDANAVATGASGDENAVAAGTVDADIGMVVTASDSDAATADDTLSDIPGNIPGNATDTADNNTDNASA